MYIDLQVKYNGVFNYPIFFFFKYTTFSLLLEDIIDRQEEAKYFPTWKIQISNTSIVLFVS